MEAVAMAVTAATGALAPVIVKLVALLDDERYKLTEGTRSGAMLMRSQLEAIHSLLPRIWRRMVGDDIDAVCKDDTMAEVRELSYDMDDAIDDFLELSLEPSSNGDSIQRSTSSTSPFDELKTIVEDVSKRFAEKWRPLVELEQVQPFPTAATHPSVGHRARLFLHEDSSELVGMDKHKEELIKLLEQGADIRSSDASGWRNGRPHFPTRTKPIKQKIVIKVAMSSETIQRSQVLRLVAEEQGVERIQIIGDDQLEVIGDGVLDIKTLTTKLRTKVGHVGFAKVGYINEMVEATKPPAANDAIFEFHEVTTVCVLGLPGGGKTTLAGILYHSLGEKFQCRVIVSASPGPGHKMTDILADILTGVTNVPYAANGTPLEQDLIDTIANFLVDKRYLVIIDDIWHWESWEIIRKSLPKNNLGTRIIMTTRFNSIAKKCLKDDNNAVFVYEIGALDSVDAWLLSNSIIRKSLPRNTDINLKIGTIKDNPCSNIVDMCYCMPLALNCISSALAEKIQELGNDVTQKWRALRLVEDGILHIPSLKPLAESLSLGYDDLPLYLRTFLLYSGVYHWRDRLDKGHLVRTWMGEGFVSEEKAAEGYFDELVDREWIKQLVGSTDYEIHPMMLAFLRCKSKEYNFVTCLGQGSDTASTSSRRIRRLSLQRGYPVDCFSSMDVSRTRSLVVLGDVKGIPFNQFGRLRVLDLGENKDILNPHLQVICECEQLSFRLSYLCLKGTGITKLPPEIRKLKHLEILYVANTKISDLPQEIGELKHLQTLDVGGTDIRELPPQIGELNNLRTLDVRNTRLRELPWQAGQISESLRVLAGDNGDSVQLPEGVNKDLVKDIPEHLLANPTLSIAILDRFGPPLVGIFKVLGRNVRIPELIKAHFKVLSCLDIGLCKLDEQDHDFLAEMPNLRALVLRFEALPRKSIPIGGRAAGDPTSEGFAKLERLRVDSRVPRITFQEGAMPKLKHLEFKFHAGLPSNDPVGITNLLSLQKVVFRCSPWYKIDATGIGASIAVVKKEAKEHHNRISLVINNGKEEILIEERKSSQDVAGSSTGTSWVYTEPAQHDNLPAVRDDYKGKGILDGRCPTCGRPTD